MEKQFKPWKKNSVEQFYKKKKRQETGWKPENQIKMATTASVTDRLEPFPLWTVTKKKTTKYE